MIKVRVKNKSFSLTCDSLTLEMTHPKQRPKKIIFLTDDRFDVFGVFVVFVTKLLTKSLKKQQSEVWRMAHWFHRNPHKGTAEQSFEIKMVQMDVEAVKVCSDLKQSRKRLIRFVLISLLRSHSLELSNKWQNISLIKSMRQTQVSRAQITSLAIQLTTRPWTLDVTSWDCTQSLSGNIEVRLEVNYVCNTEMNSLTSL